MSLTNEIASLSTAQSMAKVQMAVATKVLKTAQDQGQVVADLVSAAAESVEEAMTHMAEGLGTQIDTRA